MPRALREDQRAVAGLLARVRSLAHDLPRTTVIMEVCGTHTHAVAAAGLRRLLPPGVRLISGPGCPVCVTPVEYLDRAIALACAPGVTVATFGDLMRVPSSTLSLEQARAEGARVEVVYSPRDAVELARRRLGERVVFLAVGFETTTPTIAGALEDAERTRVDGFMILPGNKVMPPPMRVLVEDPQLRLDGFLLPGHVSVISGSRAFSFLATEHGVAGVVVGFSPTDILQGVVNLLEQRRDGAAAVVNLYGRVVKPEGNPVARALIDRYFEPCDASWRGFGVIPGSGLALNEAWAHRDASRLSVPMPPPHEPAGCRCGEVLRGVIDPPDCPLFAAGCDPSSPVGACMVSSEGTCAAWYRHGIDRGTATP